MQTIRPFRAGLLLAAVLVLFPAVGAAQDGTPSDVLTREQLVVTGRETVYDAVRRLRPRWVRMQSRGIGLGDVPVYVDGVHAGGLVVLHTLPVDSVLWVQYSTARHARMRFDPELRSPVVHVSTRLPLTEAHAEIVEVPSFGQRTTLRVGTFVPQPYGKETFFGWKPRGSAGAALGVSFPAAQDWSVLLSARRGRMESTSETNVMGTLVWGVGAGLIFHVPATDRVAPFVGLTANRTGVSRNLSTLEPPREVYAEQTLDGWGLRMEVGADTRITDQLGLSLSGGLEMNRLTGGVAGTWASAALGANWYLGRRAAPAGAATGN